MDQEIKSRLDQLETKIDLVYQSAEKTRKYILWTGIVTLVLFVLPLLGILLVAPSFLGTYTQTINDVTGGL